MWVSWSCRLPPMTRYGLCWRRRLSLWSLDGRTRAWLFPPQTLRATHGWRAHGSTLSTATVPDSLCWQSTFLAAAGARSRPSLRMASGRRDYHLDPPSRSWQSRTDANDRLSIDSETAMRRAGLAGQRWCGYVVVDQPSRSNFVRLTERLNFHFG